jgi:hypothetical protein
MRWWWGPHCSRPKHWVGFFIVVHNLYTSTCNECLKAVLFTGFPNKIKDTIGSTVCNRIVVSTVNNRSITPTVYNINILYMFWSSLRGSTYTHIYYSMVASIIRTTLINSTPVVDNRTYLFNIILQYILIFEGR